MFDRQAGVPMVVQSCDQPPPCDVLVNIGFSHSSHALAIFVFYCLCQHLQMFSLLFVRLLLSFSTIFVIVLSWPVLHLMARTTSNQPYDTNIKNYIIYHTLIILYWWKVCEDYLYPTMDWSCNPGVAVALTCALFAALPLVQVGSWPPLLRGMFFWSSQVFWWAVYKLRLKIASSVKPAQDQQSNSHQLEDVETWKRL